MLFSLVQTPALFRSRVRRGPSFVFLEESGLSLASRDFYDHPDQENVLDLLKELIFQVVRALLEDAGEIDPSKPDIAYEVRSGLPVWVNERKLGQGCQ